MEDRELLAGGNLVAIVPGVFLRRLGDHVALVLDLLAALVVGELLGLLQAERRRLAAEPILSDAVALIDRRQEP
eukprot:10620178-Alexandrium_andersonii.AAC.1